MFNFLKRKSDELPPDVGREAADVITEVTPEDIPVDYSEVESKPIQNFRANSNNMNNFNDESTRLAIEKINARLETASEFMKGFNERFSVLNQQLGELRGMSISNEKELSKLTLDSQKAVDIVREVKPEDLRIDYQKMEMKTNAISERIESNKQFLDTIMEELKDIKRKAGLFEGTEAILQLNSDVKKDLVELQKMAAKVRLNADKSEQIFIEIRKGFAENQKTNEIINNLGNLYSGIRNELERLKIDHSEIVKDNEFNAFRKRIENKLSMIESYFSQIDKVRDDQERLGKFIEEILAIEKRNESDIGDIGITIGKGSVKRVSDYDERLMALLVVIDKMASEINNIKTTIGIKKPKEQEVFVVSPTQNNNIVKPETLTYTTAPEVKQPALANLENSERPAQFPISQPVENISKQESKPKPILEKKLDTYFKETKPIQPISGRRDVKVFDFEYPVLDKNKSNFSQAPSIKKQSFDHGMNVNNLLLLGGEYVVKGDLYNAIKIYKQISKVYNPKLDKNRVTYNKVINFYHNLLKMIHNSSNESERDISVSDN